MARLGYSRDGKRGTPQIVYGLLCDKVGRPIAVEVFDGNLHDQATVPAQIAKLRQRFSLSSVVLVCDRGMVTKANIELLGEQGTHFVTALKARQVAKLVKDGELQLSLFDQQNLAEITSVDYPGERLIVCRNPLAAERPRKREDLSGRDRSSAHTDRDACRRRHPHRGGTDRPRRRRDRQPLEGPQAP